MSDRRMSKAQKRAAREGLNKFLSVLLSLAMVLQTSPVAYARWDENVAPVVPQEEVVPAEEQVTPEEEVVTEEPVAEPEATEEQVVVEPEATPEPTPEPAPEQQPVATPAISGLAIENLTTDSQLSSSTLDNHLVFTLGYAGLEEGAAYEATIALVDAQTRATLTGEPYYLESDGQWHADPIELRAAFAADATGQYKADFEKVDLHYIAGINSFVRVTLTRDGAVVADRTFDQDGEARVYVPAIASTLRAADGTQQLAAEDEAAALTDAITLSGLPKNTQISVNGALATTEDMAVAAGSATVTTDEWGKATADLNYPAFAAQTLAGKQLRSTLAITVLDRYGNQRNIATYPNQQNKRYASEIDAQVVTVAEAVAPENEPAEGEEGAGEESDDPDADPAKDTEATEATELDPNKSLEEQLDPLTGEKIEADASVAYGPGGTLAINLQGEAKDDPAKAMEILSKKVGRGEALMLAAAGNAIGSGPDASTGSYSSNSGTLDGVVATVADSDKMIGDNNIELIQVMWISDDEFTDGDDSLLSLRPGSVASRDDSYQTAIAQIDYALSGEKDYAAGAIRIMVPKALFQKRTGGQSGGTLIPLAQSPSKADDFNWSDMGDYYVFTNTKAMSAATKGFIQVMWVNLLPHEIEDAYVNVYDDNKASSYNEGASHPASEDASIESSGQTNDWYAYIEADTEGGTMRAVSNSLRAQMDTGVVATAGYKRTSSNSPYVLAKSEMPAGSIPEKYANEEYFVVVDWYSYAHYNGNQPYTLDITDTLDIAADREKNVTMDGFVYQISSQGDGPVYSDAKDSVSATTIQAGTASAPDDTNYVHVYSAYPHSQFVENTEYIFHNKVEYTLNPIDAKDTPTKVSATAAVSFQKHGSGWKEPVGHFNVFKWGNDGWLDQGVAKEYDYVAHDPHERYTISRRGYQQHYNGWHGIYKDAINALSKGDEASSGEPVRLWYTIKTEGWVLPWTLYKPGSITYPTLEGGTGTADDLQLARWDETQKKYIADAPEGTAPGENGYELVEFYRIEDNYLKRPVDMVTTDMGLKIGSTTLVPGSDYTFDYLEFDMPEIGLLKGININKGDPMVVKTNQDGTYDYAKDSDPKKIPDLDLYVEVNGVWQDSPYATVSFTSGTPVITSDGDVEGATLALPDKTTNFRTEVHTTQNAYYMEWIYPGVTLTPDGETKLHDVAKATYTDSEGNTVYQPVMWVDNGVHMDAYEYDNAGTTKVEEPIVQIEKWGSDKLTGFTEDMGVYPSKTARFDILDDVNYETRQATVHYTAEVEERTFIADRETYGRLTATTVDEDGNEVPGTILRDTKGVWYDLLPKGMMPVTSTIKVRADDAVTNYKVEENWNGTGRTMLTVWVDQTPTPQQYKVNQYTTETYWEDAPTISFDATMNLETWADLGGSIRKGITAHNVVAYETQTPGATEFGSMVDHSGETDAIDKANGNNIRTREGAFTDEEIAAMEDLDKTTDNPVFVYADATTKLAFPTAGRTSLNKNIMVDEDGLGWSQGTYDDERTVSEGGIYHYRLRMRSDSATKSKDLVLYDTLENYIAVDGNDPDDVDADRWRGKFAGIDVSQLEEMGVAPVVYYSTEDNLLLTDPDNNRRSNPQNCNIDNSSVWVEASQYTGDLADVHAIAVDCRKTADGSDFILEPNNSLVVILTMRAPWGRSEQWDDYEEIAKQYDGGGTSGEYIEHDAHAYNNVYLESVSVAAGAEFPEDSQSIKDFIRYDYTKVGLKEYNIPVEKVWDDDENRDGIRPESVQVALYANGELADEGFLGDQPNTVTLDDSNDWSAAFMHVPYTDENGDKVSYTVREVNVPEGYTARVSGSVADGYTVTNRHIPERTSLTGSKTWQLDEENLEARPAYIDVQLYADGLLQQTVRIEPENEYDNDGKLIAQTWPDYTFANLLKYRDEGTEIAYTVREQMPGNAYASAVEGMDITNTLHPYGDVNLTKKVQGYTKAIDGKDYEFQVKLETPLLDADGNPVTDEATGQRQYEPLQGEFEWEKSDGTTGAVADGGTVTLKADETITIKELPHGTRVTFTEGEMPGFTASSNGVVSTTISQNRDRALTVTNTYRATGQVNLKAFKSLEGRDLTSGKFTFELLDEEGKVLTSAANLADGTVTFDARTYGNKDDGQTYTYTIREQVPADATNADGVAYKDATDEQKAAGGFSYRGVTYDGNTTYTAKVEVNDLEGKGELDVHVTYYDADGNEVAEPARRAFSNEYHATGETQMTAWKVMEDGGLEEYKLKEDQFKFELVAVGGADAEGEDIAAEDVTMPVDGNGEPISQLKGNDAAGTVRFDKVAYTEADAGNTYLYAATEIVPDEATKELEDGTTVTWADATPEQRAAGGFAKDNIVYSSAVFGYKVDVADNGDGTLSVNQTRVAMSYDADGNLVAGEAATELPVFTNSVEPGGFTVAKLVEGETDPSQEFTFRIRLKGDDVDPNATYGYDLVQVGSEGDPVAAEPADDTKVNLPAPLQFVADLFAPKQAHAAIVDWTEYTNNGSSIKWMIEDDGTLIIEPIEGVNGVLKYRTDSDDSDYWHQPWERNRSQITSVKVTNGKTIKCEGSLTGLFAGSQQLKTVDFTGFDTSSVSSMSRLFQGSTSLTDVDFGNIDTSSVTDMSFMFFCCDSLKVVDFGNINTSRVTTMTKMFYNCDSLKSVDLTSLDMQSVTTTDNMFCDCDALESVNLSNLTAPNLSSVEDMFFCNFALTDVNLTNFNAPALTNMHGMFWGCSSLATLDLSSIDKRNVTEDGKEFSDDLDHHVNIKKITLGPNFRFVKPGGILNTPPTYTPYTGKWIRIDEYGDQVGEAYTPRAFRVVFNANPDKMAGTWVWQQAKFVIHFDANGAEGTMDDYVLTDANLELIYATDGYPNNRRFSVFNLPEVTYQNDLGTFKNWTPNLHFQYNADHDFEDKAEAQVRCSGNSAYLAPMTSRWDNSSSNEFDNNDGVWEITLYAVWDYNKYQVEFAPGSDEAAGSMARIVSPISESLTVPDSGFYRFKHVVTGWQMTVTDKDGNDVTGIRLLPETLAVGGTIPANRLRGGDHVTLTAIWGDQDTSAEANNGEFEITLHDGERAVFDDIPAGTEVEVWEKTPDGWVLVSPEDNLVTGTVKPNEYNPNAVFTNKKVESDLKGEVTLDATKLLKDLEGNDETVAAGQFSFRLYEGGKLLQTVSNAENGAITFDPIKYVGEEAVGTHTYTIEEVAGDDATIRYASEPITAKVVVTKETEGEGDEAKDVLVVSDPVYSPNNTFVNERIPEETPESHTLSVTKVAEGITEDQKPTFTFEVTITDSRGMPISGTFGGHAFDADGKAIVTIEGAGTVSIGGLPEGTIYSVSEVEIPRGWAKISEDNTQSTLDANAEATFTSTATVTNQYSSSGLIQLEAYKALDGGQIEEGQFQFGLYGNEACEGEPLQVKANGVVDTNEKVLVDGELVDNPAYNKARVSFDPIAIEAAGTYTYYIREIAGDDPAVTYDTETIITATATAVDNGKGNIETTVAYSPEAKTITNIQNPGSLAISKQVLYAGASATTKAFPVTVALTDAEGKTLEGEFAWTSDREGVEGGTIASGGGLQIHGDETVTISGLPAGAQYELTEGEVDDYTQESAEGTTGTIVAAETAKASFTNEFHKGTSVTLEATKRLEGGKLVAGAFTFQLLDAEGNVLDEATNEADGTITFDELTYAFSEAGTADEPATFEYQIREVVPEEPAAYVEYDPNVSGATVTLVNNGGVLEKEVTYHNADGDEVEAPEFVNEYTAAGTWTPEVSKELVGKDLTKGQFTFTVSRPSGAPLSSAYNAVVETDDEGNITQVVKEAVTELTAKNGDVDPETGKSSVVFPPIAFTQEDAGKTITYIIGEKEEAQDGITYDAHYYRVDVKVTDNGDGTLSATPVKTAGEKTFTNTYMKPAEGEVKVKKNLAGRAWENDDEFAFTITADKANPDATAVPANKTVKVKNTDAEHTKSFGTIKFNKAGSYRYYVQEALGDINGLQYDTSLHEVIIDVVANEEGTELVAAEGSNLVVTETITNGVPDKPKFEKKIKDVNDTAGVPSGWQDSADYDIGDDVPYRLKATLPDDIAAYKTYELTFEDEMEDSLTYNHDAAVTDASGNALEGATVTTVEESDHAFKVKVAWGDGSDYLPASLAGTGVFVHFTAELNEGAVLGEEGNVNKARLTYSNSPSTGSTGTTDWDNVIAFTYEVDVTKTDAEGNALAGAQFKLEKVVKDGESTKNVTVAENVTGTGDGANVFSFRGLDDGDYILTETKVPQGYKASTVRFTVNADHEPAWEGDVERTDVLQSLTGSKATGKIEFDRSDLSTGAVPAELANEELEKPGFEKKIADVNDSTEDALDKDLTKIPERAWVDSADHDKGDDVPFRLMATLPDDVAAYKQYEVTLEDQMEDTLLLNADSIKLVITDAKGNVLTDTGATVECPVEGTLGDHGFAAKVSWGDGSAYLPNSLRGVRVYVYFTAKLGSDAVEPVYGAQGNMNAARLTYTNSPSTGATGTTGWDNVIAFTYKVDVSKFYKDEQGEQVPLAGAEFKLEKQLKDGGFVEIAAEVAGEGEGGNVFTFEGLDDGIYRLTETTAPKGFRPAQVTFEVEAGHVTTLENWSETEDAFAVEGRNDQLTSLTGSTESGELSFDESDLPTGTVNGSLIDDELDKPGFEKKVADINDSTEKPLPEITAIPNETWADSADHDLGDDVPFRLVATLPSDMGSYRQYHVTFSDKMEDSLAYNNDATVVVKDAGGADITNQAKVSFPEAGEDATFRVKVAFGSDAEDAETLDALAGAKVYVYFTAKLTGDDVKYGAEGNMNAAKLTYTNNASSEGEGTEHEDETEWDNVIAFTYKVDFTKTDQTGQKAVNGAIFTLYKLMESGSKVVVSEGNVGSGNVFSFKGLDDGKYVLEETTVPGGYRKADDITFTVTAEHEVLLDSDGWSKTESANTVSDPARTDVLTSLTGKRTESGQIDPNDINARITFTRTGEGLAATVMNDQNAKATIEATKKFENWDLFDANAKFEFTLTAGDAKTFNDEPIGDGTSPMPEGDGATAYAKKGATTATFGEIAYEVPGIYTYTINEVDGGLPGVTYDTSAHTVTVTVNRPADNNNTLKATVTYDGNKKALEVENTFTALKKGFEVTKALTGRDWADADEFTFTLAGVGDAPMPAEAGRTATATKADKVARFGEIEFEAPGTYEYTITEEPGQAGGVTYDTAPYTVVIDVEKAADSNELVVHSLTYDGGESLTVTNEYEAEGSVTLSATKTVTGDAWPEGAKFDFELVDAEGEVIDTKTATKDAPVVTFDEIEYKGFKKGSQAEYAYTVREKVPDAAVEQEDGSLMLDGITYSDAEIAVKVNLADNGDGTLSTAVTADNRVITAGDDAAYMVGEFENVAFSRTATVELNKLLYGEDGAVTFRMTPADATGAQAAVAQADGTYVYSPTQFVEWETEVKSGETTKVESPAIKFYKRGTYQYIIEEPNAPEGWDEATIRATIVVGDGEPEVSYEISKFDGAEYEPVDGIVTLYNNEMVTLGFRSAAMRRFNNRHLVTAWQPEIRKVLENGALKAGEFTFELRDADGNLIGTATNDENGLVRFDAIRYERTAAANAKPEMVAQADGTETYTYIVREVAGTESAIIYSDEAITFTVTVSEQNGDLVAESDFEGGESVEVPTITNHYDTVKIHAIKYSREDLERGIKTPLVGAHYGLWMVNPDGNDVYIGTQTSGEDGGLLYDIPTLEGVAYYFKEEEPPPAGHLVDPYPTDYFTLDITDEGSFDLVYEYEFESQEKFLEYVNSKNNG